MIHIECLEQRPPFAHQVELDLVVLKQVLAEPDLLTKRIAKQTHTNLVVPSRVAVPLPAVGVYLAGKYRKLLWMTIDGRVRACIR